MAPSSSDIGSRRLDLAGTRDFAVAGAGRSRRAALSAFNREWLADVWRSATGGARLEGVALAAVGSLGRGDAGPLSDYDLVLLHSERSLPTKELTALADRIWYPIWDAGVRLDHSVRTVTQCRQVAAADLTAAVGLLDLSHLAGDDELVAAARATVAHDWRGNARKRLPQLVESQAARHARQGDLAQSIEPELKEAHGGLRDMTVLAALAEAWLADRPHGGVDAAHELLLDVRDAVHVVTGRGRDRLGREDHDAVAALLAYPDADDLLTAVSRAGRLIAYSLDGTVRRAGQSQRARTLRVGPRRPQMTPLGHGLFASDGEVVLGSSRLAETDEGMALRAGIVAARAGMPIAPATLENLATSMPELPTPWPSSARDLLGDLLAAGPGWSPSGRGSTRSASSSGGSRSGPPCARARSATPSTVTPSTGTSSRRSSARPASCAARRARTSCSPPRSSTTSARCAGPTTTRSPGPSAPGPSRRGGASHRATSRSS